MRYLSSIFWISLLLFTVNQILESIGIFIPIVHSYLDDVLCSPIVLGFALFVQQQFTYRNSNYVLSRGMIVLFVLWYALIFEVLLPNYSSRYHADGWDVVAYAIGAYMFFKWGNIPSVKLIFS